MNEPQASRERGEADAPTVSVIVVNYNAGDLLRSCLRAVLSSDIQLELIVSDNGSTDGSLQAVRAESGADPRLTLVKNGANLGFATANNRVLERATAPYLLLLNPDCILQSDTLRRLTAFMDQTPDAGMAGCLIRNPDGSEQRASRRRIPDPWIGLVRFLHLDRFSPRLAAEKRLNLVDEPLPDEPVEVEAISGSFMLVRRKALQEVGPLDEGYFLHCEDLDWFARFARADWKIYFLPHLEVVHHQGSCSRDQPVRVEWHKHRGMVRFFQKFQANAHPLPFRLLVIAGIWAHFVLAAAVEWIRRAANHLHRTSARTGNQ